MPQEVSPGSSLRVVVRCRPLLSGERGHTCARVVLDADCGKVLVAGKNQENARCFTFDRVLGQDSQQEDIMDEVAPLIEHVLDGLHATVFAYGQTGSGKTYTVEGIEYMRNGGDSLQPNIKTDPQQHGIIPRAIQLIFDRARQMQSQNNHVQFQLRCSFYQIYNERVTDLLNPSTTQALGAGLKIGWHRGDVFKVENLFLCECDQPEKMRRMFFTGAKQKAMSSHAMNQQSSRSHCVFTIYVTRWDPDTPESSIQSELSIVDLAGSERLTMLTGYSPTMPKESIDINTSLLALGKVITAIASSSRRKSKNGEAQDRSHVPYRDSKLTKLLKHALGGNSLTIMLACINPSDRYVDETLSTLLYAGRARKITNVPRVNEDSKTAIIRQLRAEVASMKKELEYYRGLAAGGLGEVRCIPPFKNSLADVSENGRVNELAEKLLMACESLKNILSINGKLRNALDTLTETKTDLEKREVELNAENLALRERIEMLESIALKDDFVESSSSQLNGRDVAKHHHQRRAPSVESEFSLFAPRDVLPDRPSTAQASARGRSSGFPLKRCALSSVRESSENKMSVRNTQSVQAVWGSDAPQPRRESQSADGRPFSRKISLTAAAAANKQRKEQKRSTLAKKLEEYTDRYCKPNHFANYAEYYGKARQKVPVNRAAAASIKGMEDTLKQLPYTIAETVPQSLKLASQFGALTFGGVSEDVVDLEQRRQQREAKRNALLAQQQALRLNVTQAFMNVTERLDAARSFPAFSAAPAVANPYSDASAAWSKAPQSLNLSPMPVGSSTSRLRAYLAREEAVSLHSNALNALRDATGQHRDGC